VVGKKVIIVGEMHNDLFYKCEFFKALEDQLAERIARDNAKLEGMKNEEIKNLIHAVISDLPKKNPAEAFIKRGGNGNNSTELFGKLGVPIKLMTVVGRGSEWMKDELDAMGVDTSCIFQLPKTTPISTIIEDPVTTKIFTAANLKKDMNFSTISIENSHFADASIAFFTPMSAKFEPILSKLQGMPIGVTTAITLESQAIDNLEALQQIVKLKIDVLFVNKADAISVSATKSLDDADKVLQRFARIRVITLGSEGSVIRSDFCQPVMLPVFQVKVIDRTGAGDSFAAGVLLKCHEFIEKNGNLVKYLEKASQKDKVALLTDLGTFGTAVASLKVSTARTPTRLEVAEFLKQHKL